MGLLWQPPECDLSYRSLTDQEALVLLRAPSPTLVLWTHGLLIANNRSQMLQPACSWVTLACSNGPRWLKDLIMASHKDKETSSAVSLLCIQASVGSALLVFSQRLQIRPPLS